MTGSADAEAPGRRLFFALWPDPHTVATLMRWAHAAQAVCAGRPMRPETLHLTLAFLGHVPAADACELVRAAASWEIETGELELSHFGRFAGPEIVWAGPPHEPGHRVQWLDDLHDSIWSRLRPWGLQRPSSPFRPHVTLLRRAAAADLGVLRCEPIRWTPRSCVLVASSPGAAGSRYQPLAELRLKQ